MIHCNLCSAPEKQLKFLWHKDGLDVVQCTHCMLVFRKNLPTEEELKQIYADDYFFSKKDETQGQGYLDYLKDEEYFRSNAQRRMKDIEKYHKPGHMLDVGCAAGFFIHEAAKRGWDVTGIEFSKTMAAFGNEKLGVAIKNGTFHGTHLQHNHYDLVTMFDYIEHSIDPLTDLQKAQTVLKKGGLLTLTTGDIGSLVAKVSGKKWHLLTPRHHNFYFTQKTMREYLKKCGFEVLAIGYPASVYSVRYLAHKVRTMVDLRPTRFLSSFLEKNSLGALKVPVNLWDIMTTYARKL